MTGDQPQVGVFVGVDLGTERIWAQAINADGEPLFEGPVGNDQVAAGELLDRAENAAGENQTALLVMDMITGGTVLLLTAAEQRGVSAAYVSGLRTHSDAQSHEVAAETDPKGAWVLADYARRNTDRLRLVEATERQLTNMRILTGHDEDLAADQTLFRNRIQDAMLSNCPTLERTLKNWLTSPGILDLLRTYPTMELLRKAGPARIRNLIHKRSPHLSDKAAPLIWEAVQSQTIELPAADVWARIIHDLADQLDRNINQRKQLEKTLREGLRTHPLENSNNPRIRYQNPQTPNPSTNP